MIRLPSISQRGNLVRPTFARWRTLGCLLGVAMLSACASHGPQVSAEREARTYQARARGGYVPPGPADDPWGPYIAEASAKFDVPDNWIRQVMHVESGGQLYRDGALITSNVGAMGLMQVMPGTYDELRARYDLGDDPFDPHSNILAGAAYLREMYDIYGAPGFLAAYNAGPKRLDDYLANERPLPDETRRYVAMIAPAIEGTWPATRSPAEQYAMNTLPDVIPAGLRYGRPAPVATRYARATIRRPEHVAGHGPGHVLVRVAERAEPRKPERRETAARRAPEPVRMAMAAPRRWSGFHLISPAMADTLASPHAGPAQGRWTVQLGAFAAPGSARAVLASAKGKLATAHTAVSDVRKGHATLYRARLTGLSHEAADHACRKLHGHCLVTRS